MQFNSDVVKMPGGQATRETIFLTSENAERLSARAIREQKNLEALVAEILEAAE